MRYFIGVDVGSTSTKAAVADGSGALVASFVLPTGWSSVETAEAVRARLVSMGYDPAEHPCVGTGYGRVSVPYAARAVTEITCHARGAAALYGVRDATIIDIGGQDTKVIVLDGGAVGDFVMNDKCSAGTGRFLEVMANVLAMRPDEMIELASTGGGAEISSMCTVFAESEVVSLIGAGETKENIAHAIVSSVVRKVAAQTARLGPSRGDLVLTGGLCGCPYITLALGAELGREMRALPEARYAGAYGAALIAQDTRKEQLYDGSQTSR